MENLEKALYFKMVISRPGKVLEKKKLEKSPGHLLYSYVHQSSFIKRITFI